jgi:hypothetical protein
VTVYLPPTLDMDLAGVGSILLHIIVMISPTIGYLDTVRIMIKSQSPAAYNLQIVMILNIAQGLKFFYFFYHPYSTLIFVQTFSQIAVASLLTFLKFRYRNRGEVSVGELQPLLETNPFLSWLDISTANSFCQFEFILLIYSAITIVSFYLSRAVIGESPTVEFMGLIANIVESTVSLPLFVTVVLRKHVEAVSPVLIMQYILGDILKVGLFVATHAPWPFLFGGCCQLSIDTVLLVMYLKLTRNRPEEPVHKSESLADTPFGPAAEVE